MRSMEAWEANILIKTENGIPADALDGPLTPDELELATALMIELRYLVAMYRRPGNGRGAVTLEVHDAGYTFTSTAQEPSAGGYSAEGNGADPGTAWNDKTDNS